MFEWWSHNKHPIRNDSIDIQRTNIIYLSFKKWITDNFLLWCNDSTACTKHGSSGKGRYQKTIFKSLFLTGKYKLPNTSLPNIAFNISDFINLLPFVLFQDVPVSESFLGNFSMSFLLKYIFFPELTREKTLFPWVLWKTLSFLLSFPDKKNILNISNCKQFKS